jgi:GTP diphosphokinase / guanosine-3',5'-bis(diphosphate) 3'-diphosphatase
MITAKAEKLLDTLQKQYKLDLEGLISSIHSYNTDFNENKFREAFAFAAIAHDGQTRKQEGLPYIIHPFETAKILTQIHADEPTLIAALLHDVPEDTPYTLEQIESRFGKQVAYMVEGITKLSKVHYRHDMQQREIESMKKLFIHVAEDPRTMLIKLADRLHNMRTLEYMDVPEKRLRKARETLEIFTPIAKLLGIKELQAELEDLCFLNLYPEDYAKLKAKVQESRKENSKYLDRMIEDTEKALKEQKIDAIVYSFQENLYHTFKRLRLENTPIEELDVTFSINIIASTN